MNTSLQLSDLSDAAGLVERLAAAGLSESAACAKADLLADSANQLICDGVDKSAQAHAFFVPGRIEVLGKHTDYAGGASITCAPQRGFAVVAVAGDDETVRITDAARGESCYFKIDPDTSPQIGHWSNYPMTVARRVARNFISGPPLVGARIAFGSDLPPAAGMSSSSALMVGTFLALARVNDLTRRDEYRSNIDSAESLAEYLGTVENGQTYRALTGDAGVGTFGGSEDHTAMLASRAGHLSEYSYCPVRLRRAIAMPPRYVFAIASSGVAAVKTAAARDKYNRASNLAAAVARAWRDATGRDDPHIAAALVSSPNATEKMRDILRRTRSEDFTTGELLGRFEHFVIENEQIIPAAGDALAAGDMTAFGELVDRSQKAAENLLGNQIDETIYLAAEARRLGAVAASAFGAGFGGSVWAIIRHQNAEEFLREWEGEYGKAFRRRGKNAAFFLTRPGPAAFELN